MLPVHARTPTRLFPSSPANRHPYRFPRGSCPSWLARLSYTPHMVLKATDPPLLGPGLPRHLSLSPPSPWHAIVPFNLQVQIQLHHFFALPVFLLVEAIGGEQEVSLALEKKTRRMRNMAWTIWGFSLIRWHISGFQKPVLKFDLSRFVFHGFGWWENEKTFPYFLCSVFERWWDCFQGLRQNRVEQNGFLKDILDVQEILNGRTSYTYIYSRSDTIPYDVLLRTTKCRLILSKRATKARLTKLAGWSLKKLSLSTALYRPYVSRHTTRIRIRCKYVALRQSTTW